MSAIKSGVVSHSRFASVAENQGGESEEEDPGYQYGRRMERSGGGV